MRRCVFVLALACPLGMVRPATAQTADPHTALPERPSVATHAATVAPGWLELEVGIERPRSDGRFGDTSLPASLKTGLSRKTQLTVTTSIGRPADGSLSVERVGVGLKWRIAERVPFLGAIAVMPSVSAPVGSSRRSDEDAVGLLVIASQTLGKVSLDLNAGHTRRRGDGSRAPRHDTLWAAAFGGPLSSRFGWVGEISGSPRTQGPAGRDAVVNSLVGVTATLNPSIVLDIAATVPVSGPDSYAMLGGAVWNIGQP